MPTIAELENYLVKLERALGSIPVSEKAEIVTEIKSHVLDALERDGSKGIDSVLSALGEPEQVANRFLLERGLRPHKSPKSPIVKWLVIGFLGTLGLSVFLILIVIWKFTPVIDVDEKSGRIQILGGTIKVSGETLKKIDQFTFDGNLQVRKVSRTFSVNPQELKTLQFLFTNGKLEVKTAENNMLNLRCKLIGNFDGELVDQKKTAWIVDIRKSGISECELEIPQNITLEIKGSNGKLTLKEPRFNVRAEITNGDVEFEPHSEEKYRFKTQLVNGRVDQFESSTDANAREIEFEMTNGNIEKAD